MTQSIKFQSYEISHNKIARTILVKFQLEVNQVFFGKLLCIQL